MFKKMLLVVVAGLFVLGANELSLAMTCGEHGQQAQPAQANSGRGQSVAGTNKENVLEKTVNAGNKVCPVTGEKIDEKTRATYEYEGKIYNFCCPVCIEDFKKDPQKYIRKIEEELRAD